MHDQDQDEHTDEIAAFENKWAAGFTKVDGRHVAADGLVTRKGRRRIFPDEPDVVWLEYAWLEDAAEKLGKIAKETLHAAMLRSSRAAFLIR